MATLAELKQQLTDTETAIQEVRKTGKSYSINGSHSVTNLDIKDLKMEAARLRRRIDRFQGYTGRTRPDFS